MFKRHDETLGDPAVQCTLDAQRAVRNVMTEGYKNSLDHQTD